MLAQHVCVRHPQVITNVACCVRKPSFALEYSAVLLHTAVQQIPPQISMAAARDEAEMVLFNSVRHVLEEARLKPGQVSSCEQVYAYVIGLCCLL